MKRLILDELLTWKDSPSRVPLILRGARQTGKSFIVAHFGQTYFESYVELNLEFQPELGACFSTFNPDEILLKIEALLNVVINPGKTLLFIDEIQECPKAIMALRYFKERLPQLHIIAAGSLLEFALQEENFSFPVGRVQFLYMHPCSFWEMLVTEGNERIVEQLQACSIHHPPYDVIHERLISKVRDYFFVGGMPEVLQAYLDRKSLSETQNLQNKLLQTYRSDFGKYAKKTEFKYLQQLFERAPYTACRRFKYSSIHQEMRARELKVALKHLTWAGLLYPVAQTTASGIPLQVGVKSDKFKLLYLDIGLLQRTTQIQAKEILEQNLSQINAGVLAEQFVGQEIKAYHSGYAEKNLYYWEGETRGSSAEVDFVVNIESNIIPIEVKAGQSGKLRSLKRFLELKNCPFGIQISAKPLAFEKNILTIPFYLIHELPRLIKDLRNSLG